MPKSTLPFSVPIKTPAAAREACEVPGSHSISGANPIPDVPETPEATRVRMSPGKEVFAMLNRLLASFARAEAVHQARLDQCWNGPHWHLMGHSTWSVK